MSDNYRKARGGGMYWDKSTAITTTRGEYVLPTDQELDFGEPLQLNGTGYIDDTFNKRKLKSYPSALEAGSGQVIGVGIRFYEAVDTWDADDFVLNSPKYNMRDVLAVLMGAVQVINKGASDIETMDTIIPVDGGCEKMTDSNQYSLGKALQPIPSGEKGLAWIDPDYEKATI